MNKNVVSERLSARERLLAAAGELFYEEGVNTVGIDRVIERAGVAKASLYNTFGSKDELIRAYLATQMQTRQERINARLAKCTDARSRLLGVFDVMREDRGETRLSWLRLRACQCRAQAGQCGEIRLRRITCLDAYLVCRPGERAGANNPHALADQLVLLYDGAAVAAQMDGSGKAAVTARAMAAQLLDAATT